MPNTPIPENEMKRVFNLSEFDIDYSTPQTAFEDLAKLAAKVAGTPISLVNLIDSYTQWSIANQGLPIEQMPREDSVCQYTITGDTSFQVKDLSADERFKDKFYVTGAPHLRYYYGLPLKTDEGHNVGALCVMDRDMHNLSPEKEEMLKIIADEIVNRLKTLKVINTLKEQLSESNETQRKVAHDIRGPLGGIIGLAQIIAEQGHSNEIDEVLEFINMIHKSGRSILELADEILTTGMAQKTLKSDEFNLELFKDKLEKLYTPQAKNKNINFTVNLAPHSATTPFPKNKLLQITGNIVSNAMKFTPQNGSIKVDLELKADTVGRFLQITVADSGVGMSQENIDSILKGTASSTNGTSGEQGYGFGLALVKHLVDTLKGKLNIRSAVGEGATFEVILPQK